MGSFELKIKIDQSDSMKRAFEVSEMKWSRMDLREGANTVNTTPLVSYLNEYYWFALRLFRAEFSSKVECQRIIKFSSID